MGLIEKIKSLVDNMMIVNNMKIEDVKKEEDQQMQTVQLMQLGISSANFQLALDQVKVLDQVVQDILNFNIVKDNVSKESINKESVCMNKLTKTLEALNKTLNKIFAKNNALSLSDNDNRNEQLIFTSSNAVPDISTVPVEDYIPIDVSQDSWEQFAQVVLILTTDVTSGNELNFSHGILSYLTCFNISEEVRHHLMQGYKIHFQKQINRPFLIWLIMSYYSIYNKPESNVILTYLYKVSVSGDTMTSIHHVLDFTKVPSLYIPVQTNPSYTPSELFKTIQINENVLFTNKRELIEKQMSDYYENEFSELITKLKKESETEIESLPLHSSTQTDHIDCLMENVSSLIKWLQKDTYTVEELNILSKKYDSESLNGFWKHAIDHYLRFDYDLDNMLERVEKVQKPIINGEYQSEVEN